MISGRRFLISWVAAGAAIYFLLLSIMVLLLRQEGPPQIIGEASAAAERENNGSGLSPAVQWPGGNNWSGLSRYPDGAGQTGKVTTVPTWSNLYGIAMNGRLAYLANGYRGVQTYDLSDPGRPRLLGALPIQGTSWKITLDGSLAYLASKNGGVQILDISDPRELRLVAQVETGGAALGIVVAGGRAYVANSHLGLQIIQVENPAQPRLEKTLATPGHPLDLTLQGNFLYLASGLKGGLQIFDIRGETPRLVGSLRLPGPALGLAVRGDLAYVAAGRAGLQVIDIRDPLRPRPIGAAPTEHAREITLAGTRAFILDSSGVLVFDITRPRHPALSGFHKIPGHAKEMAIQGRTACIAAGKSGMFVLDLGQPELPPAALPTKMKMISDIWRKDDLVFLAGNGSLIILNVLDPANPAILGTLQTSWALSEISVSGDHVYALGLHPQTPGERSIIILDTSDPRSPRQVGALATPGLRSLAATENLLFAGTSRNQLLIYEVTKAQGLQPLSSIKLSGTPQALYAEGDILLVGDQQQGLVVYDIADPTQPRLISTTALPWHLQSFSRPSRIALSGTTALMADGRNGLLLFDISRPHRPQLIGSVATQGYSNEFSLAGNLLYLTDARFGLAVVDISKPSQPRVLSRIPVSTLWQGVPIGEFIYLTGEEGLSIAPWSDQPSRPSGG